MEPENILVIGGSGFLGRQLVRELTEKGYRVYAVEHRTPLPVHSGLTVIRGGMKAIDRDLIRAIKPRAVFHLARPRIPRLRKFGRLISGYVAARLNQRLIRELQKSGQRCTLVFASGSLMFGSSAHPVDEDAPLNPISYARQYYRGEMPLLGAMDYQDLTVKVVRLPWLLGEGSWFKWFYLDPMKKYRAIPRFGAGNNLMQIVPVEDAASFIIHKAFELSGPGIYNLVSPLILTQLEFALAVSELSGLPVRDYRELLPGKLEKEALEAFTCNIVLKTKYQAADRHLLSLEAILAKIMPDPGPV